MLLPDEGGPQQVVDPAVEDGHDRAADGLAIDHPREVGAGRSDEEAPGFEQQPRIGQDRVRRPVLGDGRQSATEPDEVERLFVRLVRDPEATAGVDEAEARPDAHRQSPREADGGGDVLDERRRIEDVRRAEGVDAKEVEVGRRDGMRRCRREVRAVHPELARAVVADQPDALEPGVLGDRRAQEDRLDPAGVGGRSPRGAPARPAIRP